MIFAWSPHEGLTRWGVLIRGEVLKMNTSVYILGIGCTGVKKSQLLKITSSHPKNLLITLTKKIPRGKILKVKTELAHSILRFFWSIPSKSVLNKFKKVPEMPKMPIFHPPCANSILTFRIFPPGILLVITKYNF